MSALSLVNVKKKYGSLEALKGLNLEVPPGQFFGLLGPNGAGKSTLIHSIVGLCKLNEGSIRVFGHDVRKEILASHSLVGFAPQEVNLDRFFPIKKILFYQAGFFGVPRKDRNDLVDRLLHQFHLEEKADQPYYRLSGGMQKRLLIAKAVIGNPKLLILDEPTAGVDVEQRHELWSYLKGLNKDGTTIILTTHYIDEAQELCERVGIIHLGQIRQIASPQELIDRYCEKTVSIRTSLPLENILSFPFSVKIEGDCIKASGAPIGEMIQSLLELIQKKENCRILDMHVERGTLEDVFLKVTGSEMK